MKRPELITIDGSAGEGGGQILRTSLALSLVTGQPFRIVKIRAGRKKPGLLRQHLTAVQAALQIGDAVADGAEMASTELVFRPERIRPGEYRFAIGTAGSTTLVCRPSSPPSSSPAPPRASPWKAARTIPWLRPSISSSAPSCPSSPASAPPSRPPCCAPASIPPAAAGSKSPSTPSPGSSPSSSTSAAPMADAVSAPTSPDSR